MLPTALLLCLASKTLTENLYFTSLTKLSLSLRSSLPPLLYNHTLSTSATTPNPAPLNLYTSDVPQLESTLQQCHNLWDAPLQSSIYSLILVQTLGLNVVKPALMYLGGVTLASVGIARLQTR